MNNNYREGKAVPVNPSLIKKYDRNGPRYTSYPTADRFIKTYNRETAKNWLTARNISESHSPVSIYVHIPFCDTICYYCGCNKIITKDHSRATRYLHYLEREISIYKQTLTEEVHVEQLHWGGGTPTFLGMEEMRHLMKVLRSHVNFSPTGEYSIEIDPRTVDAEIISGLAELGFNRVSLGVQDFNADVQRAVNRMQSEEQTLAVIDTARKAGFRSINIDLIYGLPRQTVEGFNETLDKVIQASPDRISLYSYAHLPELFKQQRRINEAELPCSEIKLQIMFLAIQRLTEAGYIYIGMDHFAKSDDELSTAQRQGRLHRNFQGYSTHAECDLIAFGVSAIGSIGPTYYQNYRTIDEYYDCIDRKILPIMRGIQLTHDDLIRRSVIQSLICNFNLSIEAIEATYLIDFFKYFSKELETLKEFESDGLIHLKNNMIRVTESGRFLIRNICMIFDHYLQMQNQIARYSKVI